MPYSSPEKLSPVSRPLVQWHGGKFRLAPWILSFFPPHRVYVEPYGGGGSVLLRKARSYAEVYNDMDGEIVNLFRVTRDYGDKLCRLIELTPFAREEFDLTYRLSDEPIERARQLLVRSWFGMGSAAATRKSRTGFRNDVRRSGTIPAHGWAGFPEAMRAVIERLRGVVIEHMDAAALIQKMDGKETLFYVDPPYLPEVRADLGADYRHEMTEADHMALAELLRNVAGRAILSGYASELYESLYSGWYRVEKATLADGARPRVEVLWMNFEPQMEPNLLARSAPESSRGSK